jgi:hypothetical protein
MLEKLYNTDSSEGCVCESKAPDFEEKFLTLLCDRLCELFKISWEQRPLVRNLLYAVLKDDICSRGGLLEQYLHSQLDKVLNSFVTKFELDKSLKLNYTYASHAKFNSVIDAIKDKQKALIDSKLS